MATTTWVRHLAALLLLISTVSSSPQPQNGWGWGMGGGSNGGSGKACCIVDGVFQCFSSGTEGYTTCSSRKWPVPKLPDFSNMAPNWPGSFNPFNVTEFSDYIKQWSNFINPFNFSKQPPFGFPRFNISNYLNGSFAISCCSNANSEQHCYTSDNTPTGFSWATCSTSSSGRKRRSAHRSRRAFMSCCTDGDGKEKCSTTEVVTCGGSGGSSGGFSSSSGGGGFGSGWGSSGGSGSGSGWGSGGSGGFGSGGFGSGGFGSSGFGSGFGFGGQGANFPGIPNWIIQRMQRMQSLLPSWMRQESDDN